MKATVQKFRLVGISSLLGSIALDKQTYEEYIAKRQCKTAEELSRSEVDVENVMKPEDPEEAEEKITGFYRDKDTRNLILKGYQIKGFLKEAAKALKSQVPITQSTSKIDNLVFIKETNIPLKRNGEWLHNPDSVLTRPLRAMTMQGPRVSLATSEMVEDPWELEVTITILDNEPTSKKSKSEALTMDIIKQYLSYGQFKGLLQWRNGGYGSFTFETMGAEIHME